MLTIGATSGPLRKGQSSNSTDAAYAARLSTTTRPAASATRSVFDIGRGVSNKTFEVVPYGKNADDAVMNILVYGWNQTTGGLYVPRVICEVQGTMSSTLVGVASQDVVATEYFCDNVTLTTATGTGTLWKGTGDQDVAWFRTDVSGFELVELLYKLGANATEMNALARFW